MNKQKKMNSKTFGAVAIATFTMAMVLAIIGLSRSVADIKKEAIAKTPEAILANAGLTEEKNVYLSVSYFDQKADQCVDLYDNSARKALAARQFGWSECGYLNKGLEQGLVGFELDKEYLPVGKSGELTPNRGLNDMKRWFESVEGKSENYTGALKLEYVADGAEFSFQQEKFYPLDEVEFSKGDAANSDHHNHLFTMNFAVPFTVLGSGAENFEITADDDTFVFVGNKLAVDMGGVHEATTGKFSIHENGEVYSGVQDEELAYSGINVEPGEGSIVRIFHADRDSEDSVFKVKFAGMNLAVTDEKLANRKDDGVQIAYDPTDPTYVAPLGESTVVRPDSTRGLIVMATIEGVMVILFGVFMAAAIRSVVKRELSKEK